MKGIESVICKKFRKIFKNTSYKTFLVNEFRISYILAILIKLNNKKLK